MILTVVYITILIILIVSLIVINLKKNKWKFKARHDRLTGLLNREEFESLLTVRMDFVKKHPDYMLIYIMIDLDDFKMINDTKGHKEGDRILKAVAKNLDKHLRHMRKNNYFHHNDRRPSPKICCDDIICRYGGEEFSIGIICERKSLNNTIRDRFDMAAREGGCPASVGSAMFLPMEDIHVQNLTNKADFDMYRNKRNRKRKKGISKDECVKLLPDNQVYNIENGRRRYPRIKVEGTVLCRFKFIKEPLEIYYSGKLLNISEGGVAFVSQVGNPTLMKLGTKIEIEFTLNHIKHLHIAEIRHFHQNNNICGCKFI